MPDETTNQSRSGKPRDGGDEQNEQTLSPFAIAVVLAIIALGFLLGTGGVH